MKKHLAIIGGGIAGLATAWLLRKRYRVSVIEGGGHIGGHTHTHRVERNGSTWHIDSGFIVFNRLNYPRFSQLLDELGVTSQSTEMTFSVVNERSGLEYAATSLNTLFSQRRNLLRPRHYRMIGDIFRFYRQAPALMQAGRDMPIGELLIQQGFSQAFIEDHLMPMCAALWSAPQQKVEGYSAQAILRFMDNHRMLQVSERPQWRTVQGGSHSYVNALIEQAGPQIEWLRHTARSVERLDGGVQIQLDEGQIRADHVVLACHSDQALALLADPSEAEQRVLGAIPYQPNHTVLHTDTGVLPSARRCWSAWNARVPDNPLAGCSVSYYMNALQSLPSHAPDFCVSLNPGDNIQPDQVIARMDYAHPVFTPAAIRAQGQHGEINGQRNTWYAGAYWGYGFHEDGVNSAWRVAQALIGQIEPSKAA